MSMANILEVSSTVGFGYFASYHPMTHHPVSCHRMSYYFISITYYRLRGVVYSGNYRGRIRAVTLGSNFTARISYQVSFCRCKISGLELVFSVVDLDFRAVDQSIGIKPLHHSKAMSEQFTS